LRVSDAWRGLAPLFTPLRFTGLLQKPKKKTALNGRFFFDFALRSIAV
jgi:hypothetical protein